MEKSRSQVIQETLKALVASFDKARDGIDELCGEGIDNQQMDHAGAMAAAHLDFAQNYLELFMNERFGR